MDPGGHDDDKTFEQTGIEPHQREQVSAGTRNQRDDATLSAYMIIFLNARWEQVCREDFNQRDAMQAEWTGLHHLFGSITRRSSGTASKR